MISRRSRPAPSSGSDKEKEEMHRIKPEPSFDPEKFLASVGEGPSSSVLNLSKDQTVFAQGDARMPCSTSRRAR
jgi:hypothetical protein